MLAIAKIDVEGRVGGLYREVGRYRVGFASQVSDGKFTAGRRIQVMLSAEMDGRIMLSITITRVS